MGGGLEHATHGRAYPTAAVLGDSVTFYPGPTFATGFIMRIPRIMAAVVLSLSCTLGAFACAPEPEISSETPQETSATESRGVGADALLVSPGEAQSCTQVGRWVDANRANLPTDYDALGRLPMPYRLAVFGSLPPATRSALFQQQFDRYASAHPDRNAEQQAVLERARQLFTVSLYEAPPESPERPAPERAPLAAFHQQALAAFGREDTIRLFATIGPEEPVAEPALSTSPIEPLQLTTCQCTPSWDLCASNKKCIVGKIPCVRTAFLCGLTLTFACTGICTG